MKINQLFGVQLFCFLCNLVHGKLLQWNMYTYTNMGGQKLHNCMVVLPVADTIFKVVLHT